MWGIGSALVMALLGAGLTLVAVRWWLPRLPEPEDASSDKVPYAALGDWPFVIGCAALSIVAVSGSWVLVAGPARPAWLVLGTAALILAAVDARTTWLPLRLTHTAWALMAAAILAGAVLAWVGAGGVAAATVGLRAVGGALAAGGLYLLIWLVSRGGFGFGDVRFALLVGAAAAAESLTMLLWALLLGSLVGGLHGLLRLALRRGGHFPYAPAMLAGAYAALLARPLIG